MKARRVRDHNWNVPNPVNQYDDSLNLLTVTFSDPITWPWGDNVWRAGGSLHLRFVNRPTESYGFFRLIPRPRQYSHLDYPGIYLARQGMTGRVVVFAVAGG